MTTELDNTHSAPETTGPLALKLTAVLGPLPEATRCLGLHFGERTWWRAEDEGAHGEGVYSAGEVVAYTMCEVQRAVAAERERCARLAERRGMAAHPGICREIGAEIRGPNDRLTAPATRALKE